MGSVLVAGLGNVGSALLPHLAADRAVSEVFILSRDPDRARAAILDTASAHPRGAAKLAVASPADISRCDVIVLTSGLQIEEAPSRAALYERNLEIGLQTLNASALRPDAIVIPLATPVDDITPALQRSLQIPPGRIFGFGGDLDSNRLHFELGQRGIAADGSHAVGEHGRNAVPVYPGEKDYAAVKEAVGTFLSRITALGGRPRNLATGELLGTLVHSILTDSGEVHTVCGLHPGYGCYLTWPFRIERSGIGAPVSIALGAESQRELNSLVPRRLRAASGG